MNKDNCQHCWHSYEGVLMMVVQPGHMIQQCCTCQQLRTIHKDHVGWHQGQGVQRHE